MTRNTLPSLFCAVAVPALAGPPLLTDDPGTPGPNRWEINLALTSEKRRHDWEWETPLLDLNYGVGERIQLKYEIPWLVQDAHGQDVRGGPGNSLVGVKWRFLDQEQHWLSMSMYPQFEFNNPTRSAERGMVDRGTEFLLPFQLAREFGRAFAYLEVGHVWREQLSNEWLYGVALEYRIHPKLTLLGELHGTAENRIRDHELVFNAGAKWQCHKHAALMATAGRALREAADGGPDFLSYLGLQFTF